MPPLDEEQITRFATDELTRAIGGVIPRCFLAGGAYKTLLHGRPPRDLDLWAETPEDRLHLVNLLRAHGEERPPGPGAERFQLPERLVEVSFQVETMEERIARFDLGLSCVAVAFRDKQRIPLLHPLAQESVRRKEVLLIRLARPELALATLVRARRYASDLAYVVPEDVESFLWETYTNFPDSERRELVSKLRYHYGDATWGVEHEAELRDALPVG